MRVCIVVPYDLTEEGGVKRHAFQLAAALRRLGDEVTIMGASSHAQPDPDVHVFGGILNIRSNGSDNRLALLTPPWRIRRWLRDRDFDVIHVHEPLAPLLAPWASLFAGHAARVATFHAFAEKEELTPKLLRMCGGPLVLPWFDRGIAVSRPAETYARFVWKRELAIIPNGVPTDVFRAGPQHVRRDGEPVKLLFVGHWRDERKGLPTLLAAFERLHAAGLPITLDIVGQGPADTQPPEIPGVHFHGNLSSEAAIAERMRACDIFVAPTTGQESFGIVLLEAMASARSIICTDIDGYRQVVTAENAHMVAPGNVDALAEAIENLVQAPARRQTMGEVNRVRAETYDWDNLVHRVREEYVAAIAQKHNGHKTNGHATNGHRRVG